MKNARILALAMLVAALGVVPSRAETTAAHGTVTLMKAAGMPDHETIQYYAEGCAGSHPDAVFEAFVDVRALAGKTLRFTATGADVTAAAPAAWRLTFATTCDVRTFGSFLSTTTTATFVVPEGTSFLSLTFFTSGVVNAHYELDVL